MTKTKNPTGYKKSWMVFEKTAKGWLVQRDQQGERISSTFRMASLNAKLMGGVAANYWDMPADESEWDEYLDKLAAK